MGLIDKNKLLEELEKLKQNLSASPIVVIEDVESLVESFEEKEVDLTNRKTDWCPNKKQIESLHDLLKYNIGVFDYNKFMEVQSLYDDLIKYETNRQRQD